MKRFTFILAWILYVNCSFSQEKGGFREEMVLEANVNDSIPIQINLRYHTKTLPDHYFSHVETPVCKEGLCYWMIIDIYWDLLGNFSKYEVPGRFPLTKFDHEKFTAEDHEKLMEILSNKDSFLRFYALENLVDTTEQKSSKLVDGVSGATHKSIQSDVVAGAVFSTYVLWHIVNGPVADQILEYTETRLFDDSLMIHLLESGNHHYEYYALEKVTEENSPQYLPHIIRLIADGSHYVPYFAIEKITEETWKSPKNQISIIGLLGEVNFEMQNELLNRIKGVSLSEDALDIFVSKLQELKDSQLLKALAILNGNQDSLSNDSRLKIADLTKHPNKEIAARTALILENSANPP